MAEQVQLEINAKDNATDVLNSVIGSFGKFKGSLLGLTAGVAAVGAGLVTVANNVANFEKFIARAGANVNASTEDLKAFRKVAIDATRDTMFGAEDAAEALYFLAGGSISAKEAQEALDDVIKFSTAAGFDDLRTGVLAVADAMVLFKLRDEEVTRATDVLTRAGQISFATMEEMTSAFQQSAAAASMVGMSYEETVGVLGALADAGFRGMEGGTALKRALEQLSDRDIQDQLKAMGVSVVDASGNFVGFIEMLKGLEEQMQGMTGFEKQAVLADIFGQLAGPRIAALLGMGTEAIVGYVDELNNAEGATERTSAAVSKAINPVTQLNNRWFEFQTKIAPAVIMVLQGVIDFVDGLYLAVNLLIDAIAEWMFQTAELVKILVHFGGEVVDWLVGKWNSITDGINRATQAVRNFIQSVKDAAASVAGGGGLGFTNKIGDFISGKLGFASGGIVPGPIGAPQMALVHGGEQIIPPASMRGQPGGGLGGGIVINITGNNIASDLDISELARRVGDEVMTSLRFNTKF